MKEKKVISFDREKMEKQIDLTNQKVHAWKRVEEIVCKDSNTYRGCQGCKKTIENVINCLIADEEELRSLKTW